MNRNFPYQKTLYLCTYCVMCESVYIFSARVVALYSSQPFVCLYASLSCLFIYAIIFFLSLPIPLSICLPVILNVFWPVQCESPSRERAMIGRTDATIGAEDRLISAIRIGRLPTECLIERFGILLTLKLKQRLTSELLQLCTAIVNRRRG